MAIATNQLTVAQLDAITVPAGKKYAILNISVCNNSGTQETFDLHFIPSGDSLNTSVNRIGNAIPVDGTDTFVWDFSRVILEAGDKVSFTASNTTLSAIVSYMEA